MPLKEISQWIEDNSAWEIGKTMFTGHLPQKTPAGTDPPTRCVAILENTPGATEPDLPDRIDKAIQIWNRGANYFDARNDAVALYELMAGTHGWNLPELTPGLKWLAMTVDAMGSPAPIENPDEKGNFVFSTNYIWRLEKAEC